MKKLVFLKEFQCKIVLKLLKNYNFNLIGEIDKGGHDYYLSNYDLNDE